MKLEELPPSVRDAAELGLDLVRSHTGVDPDATAPDWTAVASTLEELGQDPSTRVNLVMASALVLGGQRRLALEEMELLDPDAFVGQGRTETAYHAVRGIVYRLNGLAGLASPHLEAAAHPVGGEDLRLSPGLQTGLHALVAANHLARLDLAAADRELADLARTTPDSPIVVFLTGERLTAAGEYEQAASSLEEWASTLGDEELARQVSERARALRDGTGEPGLLVEDPEILAHLIRYSIDRAADESELAGRVAQWLEQAEQLAHRLLDKLPGTRWDPARTSPHQGMEGE
jgi:hypothetical protein